MDIYFILLFIIQYYATYFVAQIVPTLAIGGLLQLALYHRHTPSLWFFWVLPYFSGASRLMLYITYPSHFSNEPGFFLLKNGIRNKDLGTDVPIVPGCCRF